MKRFAAGLLAGLLVTAMLPVYMFAEDDENKDENDAGGAEIEIPVTDGVEIEDPGPSIVDVLLGKQERVYRAGKSLTRISADKIKTTDNRIIVEEPSLSVGGVVGVFIGKKELTHKDDYTIRKSGDTIVIKFTAEFMAETKPGKYTIYIEFTNHSAETSFEVADVDGYYTAEPPRTKR